MDPVSLNTNSEIRANVVFMTAQVYWIVSGIEEDAASSDEAES